MGADEVQLHAARCSCWACAAWHSLLLMGGAAAATAVAWGRGHPARESVSRVSTPDGYD